MGRPDKLMTASWDQWFLTASTAPSLRARRVPPSWWTPAWALAVALILSYSGYALLALVTVSSLLLHAVLPLEWLAACWVLFLAALGGGGWLWERAVQRALARAAPITALNDESWDTMTQVLARLGGSLSPHTPLRGFWYLASANTPRNTWSLQAALPHGGHVEIDYLITPHERRLRVAAQGVPGQTLRDLELALPADERGHDDPARLAEQVGRFLLTAAPEALASALQGADAVSLTPDRGGALASPEGAFTATLSPLRPASRAPNPRRALLYLLVAWRSYALALAPLALASLAGLGVLAGQDVTGLAPSQLLAGGLGAAIWVTLGVALWWALRPSRPQSPPRAARGWSAALSLDADRLAIAGQGEISLASPFSLQLSRAPLGPGRALLVVEVLQRGPEGVRRLRLCAPARGAAQLPELQTDAPLVSARALALEIWPRLRAAAAMHGADPGWALSTAEAAPAVATASVHQEVSAVAL